MGMARIEGQKYFEELLKDKDMMCSIFWEDHIGNMGFLEEMFFLCDEKTIGCYIEYMKSNKVVVCMDSEFWSSLDAPKQLLYIQYLETLQSEQLTEILTRKNSENMTMVHVFSEFSKDKGVLNKLIDLLTYVNPEQLSKILKQQDGEHRNVLHVLWSGQQDKDVVHNMITKLLVNLKPEQLMEILKQETCEGENVLDIAGKTNGSLNKNDVSVIKLFFEDVMGKPLKIFTAEETPSRESVIRELVLGLRAVADPICEVEQWIESLRGKNFLVDRSNAINIHSINTIKTAV
jgi:hypothetical protein